MCDCNSSALPSNAISQSSQILLSRRAFAKESRRLSDNSEDDWLQGMLFIHLQIIWGGTLHPSRQYYLPRASLAWSTTIFLQSVIASNKKVKAIVDGCIYLDFHAGPALPYPQHFA